MASSETATIALQSREQARTLDEVLDLGLAAARRFDTAGMAATSDQLLSWIADSGAVRLSSDELLRLRRRLQGYVGICRLTALSLRQALEGGNPRASPLRYGQSGAPTALLVDPGFIRRCG